MALIIDRGFTIRATPEERLAELEHHITWLFDQQDQAKMSVHDVSYEVATIQDERLAIIKRQAARQRRVVA